MQGSSARALAGLGAERKATIAVWGLCVSTGFVLTPATVSHIRATMQRGEGFRLQGWDLGSPFPPSRAWGVGGSTRCFGAPAQRVRMARRCGLRQGCFPSRTGRDPFFLHYWACAGASHEAPGLRKQHGGHWVPFWALTQLLSPLEHAPVCS